MEPFKTLPHSPEQPFEELNTNPFIRFDSASSVVLTITILFTLHNSTKYPLGYPLIYSLRGSLTHSLTPLTPPMMKDDDLKMFK